MAISTISSTLFPSLTIPNASSPKSRFTILSHSSPVSFNPLKLPNSSLKHSQSTTKIFAAPEALEETPEVEGSKVPTSSVSLEADKAARK
ncbi:hypothetical protein J1N35_012652 [Gossypium stocksii]|uniref:Uncharacterized protein n=1 Tax=Gossypium stocksii TaxID=47602 RepID=A0A9D4AEC7_9ROSI|nr:hypothetical protein J1N35_012652 [Gossypium stocksii]